VEHREVVARRRMVRAFSPEPVEPAALDRLLHAALRAPSAGNSQGTELVVLVGPEETAGYWDAALPAERRERFGWPALPLAPVLVVVLTVPARYLDRYGEPDKVASGLGGDPEAWVTPYWWVDGGMAAHAILLGAVDEGLGALFFGVFGREEAVRSALDLPADRGIVGVIALGHPEPSAPGRSAGRPRRPTDEVIHRGGYRRPSSDGGS
jgi:nitroreductase